MQRPGLLQDRMAPIDNVRVAVEAISSACLHVLQPQGPHARVWALGTRGDHDHEANEMKPTARLVVGAPLVPIGLAGLDSHTDDGAVRHSHDVAAPSG